MLIVILNQSVGKEMLRLAVANDKIKIVQYLLENNTRLSHLLDTTLYFLFFTAIQYNRREILCYFIERTNKYSTPLRVRMIFLYE